MSSDHCHPPKPKQSACCETPAAPQKHSCCEPEPSSAQPASSCCPEEKGAFDWLLWSSLILVALFYAAALLIEGHDSWYAVISHSVKELMNTMWWGILLGIFFVGVLSKVPQEFVMSVLGPGGTFKGRWRATLAGVLLDLCSHGILMVGMELRRKGASLGQVMAFLIASPWNSLSLTIILVALIGMGWTLAFIALSVVLALTTGWMFDRLEARGTLPANTHQTLHDPDFDFWPELRKRWGEHSWTRAFMKDMLQSGLSGSRMVLRWLLFGVLLASAIRGFVSLEDFQNYFGASLLGLLATLVAATIIEVCSEGSTPIAADLMNRAKAPGNSFAFLMTGVSTDYTEVMVIKDTTKSWKTALFLPLLTVPQVVLVAIILNQFAA